jgi:UTP--glucose-1-phosphate uridylyltransferase
MWTPFMPEALDQSTTKLLARFRFDAAAFERLRCSIQDQRGPASAERVQGEVAMVADTELKELPALDSAEGKALTELGQKALAAGEVGVVILAGGMATRFGGVVKATVEVVPGHSFLQLKLADIARAASAAGTRISTYLLASHATRDALCVAAGKLARSLVPVEVLEQSVTLRLLADGTLFRDANGNASLCATGHGDLLATLRDSGALGGFRAAGGRVLMVSNVDNLAATLEPRVIGAHLRAGRPVTVEIVRKMPGDRGGIPLRVAGHHQIVEEFRLPPGFDSSRVPFFNTNTFMLDAEAIDREFALDWFLVHRKVDGQDVLQPERLLGQITAYLMTQFLVVPRHGPEGRFLPVKDRDELGQRLPEIQTLLARLGIKAKPAGDAGTSGVSTGGQRSPWRT